MIEVLEFETEVVELENNIIDLKKLAVASPYDLNINSELKGLQSKYEKVLINIYSNLTPWQKVLVARHSGRPHSSDYINNIFDDFIQLSGDRLYGDDKSIIGGIAKINSQTVVVIGIEKGKSLEGRVMHNFGMPNPEGYRKAVRLINMADKFSFPIISLIDTPGAYPGLEAEERGQGEAIARSIEACLKVKTPFISIIIGEGGSGGALALAASDVVLMLEHSVYSVISPEGCASILWKNEQMKEEAANNLSLTSKQLLNLGLIEDVIKEPIGAAHRNFTEAFISVKKSILHHLDTLSIVSENVRQERKHERFLKIGLST